MKGKLYNIKDHPHNKKGSLDIIRDRGDNMKSKAKSEALKKKKIPKEYRGNTNSEGGIPFGKKPR